jgi:isochorismate pyruvate lyase
MKKPEECSSLEDIRTAIDALDRELVELLGCRLGYVFAAARFKPTEESIAAPDRVAAMLVDRQAWAASCGLSPTFVAELFSRITQWYIATQTEHWRQLCAEQGGRP